MSISKQIESLEKWLDRIEKEVEKFKDFKSKAALRLTLNDLLLECKYIDQNVRHLLNKSKSEEDHKKLNSIVCRTTTLMEEVSRLLITCEDQEKNYKLLDEKVLPKIIKNIVNRTFKFWWIYSLLAPFIGYMSIAYAFFIVTFVVLTLRLPFPFYIFTKATIEDLLALTLGLIFAFVLHEFFHAAIAIVNGVEIKAMGFTISEFTGGFIHIDQKAYSKGKHFLTAFNAAGISGNMLLGLAFCLCANLMHINSLFWFGMANMLLGLINSFPFKFSDGGWLYKDFLEGLHNKSLKKIFKNIPYLIILIWIALLLLKFMI